MWLILPFLWGILEAILLFMVPDVPVSMVTLKRGAKAGAIASLAAAVGAAIGGIVMFYWGRNDIIGVLALIEKLPAISPQMIDKVMVQMHGMHPFVSMLIGSFQGTPYKIYASIAASVHIPIWQIVLFTPLIRLPRFLLVAGITNIAAKYARKIIATEKIIFWLAIVLWAGFYVLYWTIMPG